MHAGGPRVAVHLRAPRVDARRLFDLACRIAELQSETGAWLVVNDRADVALTAGARGVQLTSRAMSPADARLSAPALYIGGSVHSPQDATAAVAAGGAWVPGGGPVLGPGAPPGGRGGGPPLCPPPGPPAA